MAPQGQARSSDAIGEAHRFSLLLKALQSATHVSRHVFCHPFLSGV